MEVQVVEVILTFQEIKVMVMYHQLVHHKEMMEELVLLLLNHPQQGTVVVAVELEQQALMKLEE